jgi:hypothetical protein
LGSFSVFPISDFIDNPAELVHYMEQVKDDLHVGDLFFDGLNIGVPHIHSDGFQFTFLPFGQKIEECF